MCRLCLFNFHDKGFHRNLEVIFGSLLPFTTGVVNFIVGLNHLQNSLIRPLKNYFCDFHLLGYVHDWTLNKEVAIDEIQVGGLIVTCRFNPPYFSTGFSSIVSLSLTVQ